MLEKQNEIAMNTLMYLSRNSIPIVTMQKSNRIILASKSEHRARLLKSAGVKFFTRSADIDERAVEAPLLVEDIDQADIAMILAHSKAISVSEKNKDMIVIGCDQTLEFENQRLHKPVNMEEARRRLLLLSGKTHYLHSAIALAKNEEIIWQHTHSASIKFRKLEPEFIGRHLARVGDNILSSVGAYQIEGEGIQLFEKIEGDYFSIIGLPLLPLLAALREIGEIDG